MNKIFVFMHNPRREQCAGHALADDGTLLMSEPFEDEEHMRAAFIDYPHPDVVARYKKHFPNGYKLELIYYDYLPHRKDVRDAIAASVRNGTSLMFYADNVSNWVRDEMRTTLRRLVELDATPEMMEDELTAWLGFQVDVKPIRADYEATHGTDTFDVLLGTTRITRITTHFIWFESSPHKPGALRLRARMPLCERRPATSQCYPYTRIAMRRSVRLVRWRNWYTPGEIPANVRVIHHRCLRIATIVNPKVRAVEARKTASPH